MLTTFNSTIKRSRRMLFAAGLLPPVLRLWAQAGVVHLLRHVIG